MIDNQDPLSQLWQEQIVEQADFKTVSKKWHKVKLKQRFYALLDVFGLAIPVVLIWLNIEKLDSITLGLALAVMGIGVVGVAYITWLRRFAIGWSNVPTEQHIEQLKKQIENNIKIANLSLHSVWFMLLLFIVFYALLYYFQVFPMEKFLEKLWFTAAVNAVALPAIWIWAAKRKKRFVKELHELTLLLTGDTQ